MRDHPRLIAAALFAVLSMLINGFATAAVNEPDCASLQGWAGSLSQNATFEPRPGIVLNTLFEDERLVPLFGTPILAWQREDLSSVQGWLANCRKKAMAARNRSAGDALYATLKEVKRASRSLRDIWTARRVVEQRVESLVALRPSPELPEILGIGQAALQGEDVSDRLSALPRQWQGYGKQAAQLGDYRNMLSDDEIAQWVAKLEAKRGGAAASVAKRNAAHEALLAEIAAVPVSQGGLATLNRIAYRADPGAMTREEQDSYNRAFQNKRQQIQQQVAAQQAQAARDMTTLPAPARKQVAAVLEGDAVDEVSIRGLRPGPGYSEIKAAAARLWGYAEAISLGEEDKQLTTKRRDFTRLMREERRDGGLLNLRTRKGRVGELSYVEHFPGPLDIAPLKADLQARFGKSDDEKRHSDGSLSMTWRDGERYLRVRAGNRVTPARQHMGVRSSVEITLWTEDFADYLADAAQRCNKLRDKPVRELSINDKQAILLSCLTP